MVMGSNPSVGQHRDLHMLNKICHREPVLFEGMLIGVVAFFVICVFSLTPSPIGCRQKSTPKGVGRAI